MEDKEKDVSVVFTEGNSLCKDVGPEEKDRPLDGQAVLAGEVLKEEQWCGPGLSRWHSGAQQGWQLEAEGQEWDCCSSPGQEASWTWPGQGQGEREGKTATHPGVAAESHLFSLCQR